MKQNINHSQKVTRISRRENLPLLRGMFVVPGSVGRKHKTIQRTSSRENTSEDELFLTSEKGFYLGE